MIITDNRDFNIAKIADSGQCFRLNKTAEGYRLIAHGRVLNITVTDDICHLHCPKEDEPLWHSYFDLDTDYAAFRAAVPPQDDYLCMATAYGRGIRILNQDPWEMLISFIISQRKSIPSIKTSIEALSRRFGEPLGEGLYAFPSAKSLATAPTEELSACSLGYRTGYVRCAASMVLNGELRLEELRQADDEGLINSLMSVRGVGAKVAHCVSLFGYHRLNAFPRDVWINRVIDTHYNGSFDLSPYLGFAGVIQQYMFFYGRNADR